MVVGVFTAPRLVHNLVANLRNGVLADISAPSRAAAVAPAYYWVDVAGGTAGNAPSCIALWVATCYGRLGAAEIAVPPLDNAGAAANAGAVAAVAAGAPPLVGFAAQTVAGARTAGTAADWGAHVTAAAGSADLRRRAIVLGSARASVSANYGIATADLTPTELDAQSIWTFAPAAVAAPGAPAVGLPGDPDYVPAVAARAATPAAAALTSHNTDAAGNLTFAEALADAFAELSDEEWDLAMMVYLLAAAAPPLAGLSIQETDHHFLSTKPAAVLAVEKQVKASASVATVATYEGNLAEVRDLIWHKACHPVAKSLLTGWANDVSVKAKLQAAGLGSAAVRLPYIEPELKAAKAYLAVLDSIRTWVGSCNHSIEMTNLAQYVAAAELMPRQGVRAPAPGIDPCTRREFIEVNMAPFRASAAPVAAFCVGVLMAMCDDTGVQFQKMSVAMSYAVRKLVVEKPSDVGAGNAAYAAARVYARNQAEKGKLAKIVLRA